MDSLAARECGARCLAPSLARSPSSHARGNGDAGFSYGRRDRACRRAQKHTTVRLARATLHRRYEDGGGSTLNGGLRSGTHDDAASRLGGAARSTGCVSECVQPRVARDSGEANEGGQSHRTTRSRALGWTRHAIAIARTYFQPNRGTTTRGCREFGDRTTRSCGTQDDHCDDAR